MMQSIDEYMESAYSHLDAADTLLTRGLYKLAVFHLHQALEFLLKALLIKRGYKPMKTHALHLLARGYQLTPEDLTSYVNSQYTTTQAGTPMPDKDMESQKSTTANKE